MLTPKQRHINRLRKLLPVGKVVYFSYWKKYDKILAFNVPGTNGCEYSDWSVTVVGCDADGNVLEEPREHCTHPEMNERI